MSTKAPKTTLQQRLARTYRIPNGAPFHKPAQRSSMMGGWLAYGEIVSMAKEGQDYCAEATGDEMMQSILLAQRELNRIQGAIDSMVRLMDEQDAEHDAVAHLCAIAQETKGSTPCPSKN